MEKQGIEKGNIRVASFQSVTRSGSTKVVVGHYMSSCLYTWGTRGCGPWKGRVWVGVREGVVTLEGKQKVVGLRTRQTWKPYFTRK